MIILNVWKKRQDIAKILYTCNSKDKKIIHEIYEYLLLYDFGFVPLYKEYRNQNYDALKDFDYISTFYHFFNENLYYKHDKISYLFSISHFDPSKIFIDYDYLDVDAVDFYYSLVDETLLKFSSYEKRIKTLKYKENLNDFKKIKKVIFSVLKMKISDIFRMVLEIFIQHFNSNLILYKNKII